MKGIYWIFAIFVIVSLISLYLFLNNPLGEKENPAAGVSEGKKNINGANEGITNNTETRTSNESEIKNVGGIGGSSGEGAGRDITSQNLDYSCSLVRPGNLPDIDCFVNYISNEGLSLKIKNNLGESFEITIKVDSCSPENTGTIENLQEKDFIFSCDNLEYFNQALLVTYSLEGNKKISVGGFVSGKVIPS